MDNQVSRFRTKRPLSEVDDADECMPISKRIDNLNIKGPRTSQDTPPASLQPNMGGAFNMQSGPADLPPNNNMPHYNPHLVNPAMYNTGFQALPVAHHHIPSHAAHHHHVVNRGAQPQPNFDHSMPLTPPSDDLNALHNSLEEDEQMSEEAGYNPELGETDNPHYFHINRVLFEAHSDRCMRQDG